MSRFLRGAAGPRRKSEFLSSLLRARNRRFCEEEPREDLRVGSRAAGMGNPSTSTWSRKFPTKLFQMASHVAGRRNHEIAVLGRISFLVSKM